MEDDVPVIDDVRGNAIFQLYGALPLLEWTTAESMGLTEEFWESVQKDVEKNTEYIQSPENFLKDVNFWNNVVKVAMNTTSLQQFFMEQLIRHNYVVNRGFLHSDPDPDVDKWIACDVFQEKRLIYTTEPIQLVHEDEIYQVVVLEGVNQPHPPLPFSELVHVLNAPFFMGSKKEGKEGILFLKHDYDPLYFNELFNVGEDFIRSATQYASPLFIHDILMRNQLVSAKKGKHGEDVVASAINAILPTAGEPYRRWYRKDPEEAAYLMEQLYYFLSFQVQ